MIRVAAAFGRLFDALAAIAALILLAMVVAVTADIVLRNTVRAGFVWANEVSEYALYLMTLLTAPWLLRRGQHVRLDLVLTMVPRRLAWMMEALGDLLGFAVCLVLIRYGFAMTADNEVRWISVGLRCLTDDTLGVYTDWKIDYGPTAHLLTGS